MDKREELMRSKALEIQDYLKEWALGIGILRPGEQVIFYMDIQNVPVSQKRLSLIFLRCNWKIFLLLNGLRKQVFGTTQPCQDRPNMGV